MTYFFIASHEWSEADDPALVNKLAEQIDDLHFDSSIEIKSLDLKFYDKFKLYMVKAQSWEPSNLFIYALWDGETMYWLDGTSPPIHALNQTGALSLSEANAKRYLEFFSFFVRGEEGPFYVIDTPTAPYLPDLFREEIEEHKEVLATFRKRYQSPRAFGTDIDGCYLFSALVYYSNAIFAADFKIAKNGMVEIEGDEPLMTDLPVKIDCPIKP